MSRTEFDAPPESVRKGMIHVDGNVVQWTATADAVKLEDGRVQIAVVYPRTGNRDITGTAEFPKNAPLIRIVG